MQALALLNAGRPAEALLMAEGIRHDHPDAQRLLVIDQ